MTGLPVDAAVARSNPAGALPLLPRVLSGIRAQRDARAIGRPRGGESCARDDDQHVRSRDDRSQDHFRIHDAPPSTTSPIEPGLRRVGRRGRRGKRTPLTPSLHQAVVLGSGLEVLDESQQAYPLWAIDGGAPESIGLMRAGEDGSATVTVPYDAEDATTLAITVEPAGGSPAPTTDPILTAEV